MIALALGVVVLAVAIRLSGDRWIPWWGEGRFGTVGRTNAAAAPPAWIPVPSGNQLAVRETRPTGETIALAIVIHGLGLHGAWYADLSRQLARAGIVAVSVDLPGHGVSQGRRGTVPARPALLADLAAVIHAVVAGHPRLPLLLIGHSLGVELILSPELLRALARTEVAVSGVAALAPYIAGAGLEAPFDPRYPVLSVNIRGLLAPGRPALRYNWPGGFDDPLLQRTFDRSLLTLWRGAGRATDRLRNVPVPLLLLIGADDRIISPCRVAALAGSTCNPSVAVQRVERADHMSVVSLAGPALVAWAHQVIMRPLTAGDAA